MLDIYIDADGCPVKEETYKVARRYGLMVYVVSNRHMNLPLEEKIRGVVVSDAFDAADDWIAERAGEGDLVITSDLPLADRCIRAGAYVLTPKGQEHNENTIGSALATRELMDQLRQMGEMAGGPAPMQKRDKSHYLSALDNMVQRLRRA